MKILQLHVVPLLLEPLLIVTYTSTSRAVEGISVGMAYEKVAASLRLVNPMRVAVTEVQF